jgi:MoaA/NifB/PqqE/SkfB family radical SAM enzyme
MVLDEREQRRRLLLRLKGIESGRPLIGPAVMHLRLTDLCNLRCQYCWHYGPHNPHPPSGKNHLDFDVFESVARDCAELQVDTINLSGIGDPTFHPRFYEMLPQLERSFAVTIFTNGTFPIERCRDILRADRIIINLGEADRERYKALQGKDLFLKVIKNIGELNRLRPQVNPDFFIEVVFIMTRLNVRNSLKTELLVKKLGANLVRKKVFEESKFNRHMTMPDQGNRKQAVDYWPPCYHGWFYSAIKLNGDVNVCCYSQSLTIGNVYARSFKDLWLSQEYARARSLSLSGGQPFRNDHDCQNCRASRRNLEIGEQMRMYNRLKTSL